MTKTNRNVRILSLLLLLTLLFSAFATEALAANVSGSTAKKVFIVSTDNKWYHSQQIKLTKTKGVAYFYTVGPYTTMGNTSKKAIERYGQFRITVEKINKNGKTISKPYNNTLWNSNGAFTIKLDKNSTYRITVTPSSIGTNFAGWKTASKWSVSSIGSGIYYCR